MAGLASDSKLIGNGTYPQKTKHRKKLNMQTQKSIEQFMNAKSKAVTKQMKNEATDLVSII